MTDTPDAVLMAGEIAMMRKAVASFHHRGSTVHADLAAQLLGDTLDSHAALAEAVRLLARALEDIRNAKAWEYTDYIETVCTLATNALAHPTVAAILRDSGEGKERAMIRDDCPELMAAAKWWTEVLRNDPPKDTGDGFLNAALTRFSVASPVTDERLAIFECALRERVAAAWNLDGWLVGGWEKAREQGNPLIGSGNRVIATDYHPEGPLAEAANDAGIPDLRFPVKTAMWVSPGEVSVSHGYGAKPVVIYREGGRDDG